MYSSKLIKVLKSLSKAEKKQFSAWISSDFINTNENIKQFAFILLELSTSFNGQLLAEALDKKKLFKKVFPKLRFNNLKINNLISDTYISLCDFLSYQNFQNSRQLARLCLMDELQQKELNEIVEQEAKKFEQEQQKLTIRNSSFYFDEYLFYKQGDTLFLSKPNRKADPNLQLKNDNLDLFYFSTKLKIACDMMSRNAVIQANYDASFLTEIVDNYHLNSLEYEQIPAISIYYNVLQMLKNQEDNQYYHQVKSQLADNLNKFPNEELRTLYDYLRNYCIRKLNSGETKYYQEVLNLYQFLLENKIIFKNGYLSEWDYKNIITVGLRLQSYEWTENFIKLYKESLPKLVRQNAFIYNLASFYYETHAYKKSLQLLHEVKFTDTSYHLGAKIIQLKSYYELEETEPFYALTDAFQIYVKRSRQLSDYRKTAYLNLIKITKKVYKLKEQKGIIAKSTWQSRYEKVQLYIDSQRIANKDWIENELGII